jgi:hypothetical protein
MGFVEETGAAQHLRDARILPIYEGTNGHPGRSTSVTRKLPLSGGEAGAAGDRAMRAVAQRLVREGDDRFGLAARACARGSRASTGRRAFS